MADITDTIETQATQPAAVTVDGQSVTNRSVADLIAADKYLRSQATVDDECLYGGASHRKIVPPGTT